jgi:hypothetical protein
MSNTGSGYPSDWNSRRKEVYSRDNYECQNCGAKGGPVGNAVLHAHHIVPKSKGGTHKKSNLKTLCKGCHNAIHGDADAPSKTSRTRNSRGSSSHPGTPRDKALENGNVPFVNDNSTTTSSVDISTTEVTRPWEADGDASEWYLSDTNMKKREYAYIIGFILLMMVSAYLIMIYDFYIATVIVSILYVLCILAIRFFRVNL